ncbi:MAG: YggU family protein [Methanopyri archaeon]|nr:YggU family protein [Methanopyri archaeon]
MKDPFEEHPEGTLVRLRVNPGAPRTEIKGVDEWRGALEVNVSEPPRGGRANRELIRFLKKLTGTDVELVSGETSRDKTVLIKGLDPEEARRVLTR